MSIKRDKYDAIVSDLIRHANDFTCERCGVIDEEGRATGKSRQTHCSHFYGRSIAATRYDLHNLSCLCGACHKHLGDRPSEHAIWFKANVGDYIFEEVEHRHWQTRRWKKWEKDEMLKHYKLELERVKKLRSEGVTGFIRVVNYE